MPERVFFYVKRKQRYLCNLDLLIDGWYLFGGQAANQREIRRKQ